MPVIGINIKSIDAKRDDVIKGNIKVNSTPELKNVEKKSVASIEKDVLSIDFEFRCNYSSDKKDNIGEINFGGNVLFLVKDPDKTMKDWEENKDLDENIVIPVINNVMRKCLTRAINLSEELQLPPPLRFPKASKGNKTSKYIK